MATGATKKKESFVCRNKSSQVLRDKTNCRSIFRLVPDRLKSPDVGLLNWVIPVASNFPQALTPSLFPAPCYLITGGRGVGEEVIVQSRFSA